LRVVRTECTERSTSSKREERVEVVHPERRANLRTFAGIKATAVVDESEDYLVSRRLDESEQIPLAGREVISNTDKWRGRGGSFSVTCLNGLGVRQLGAEQHRRPFVVFIRVEWAAVMVLRHAPTVDLQRKCEPRGQM